MTLAVERYGDASYLTTAIELESRVRTVIDSTPGATLYPASRDSAASHSSDATEFSPFIISFQVPPIPGEVLARVLSDAGVAVSRGSACAENLSRRGTQEITHVVRVSTGYGTSNEDIAEFGRVLAHVVKNMRGDLMRGDPS
jgi:cysteine sulfinate desulfinase/cysteine desulfurase-like protein